MTMKIARVTSESISVSVTASPNDSGTFALGERSGGLLHVVSASAQGLSLLFASVDGDTPYLLNDSENNPVTLTISAGGCYALPDELFAAKKVMLLLTSGTATVRVSTKT